jgi:hypothetical protein
MRYRSNVLLGALAALLVLSTAIAAEARRLELSSQRFWAIWEGANKLTVEAPGLYTVACNATIEGTFHSRTLSKVSGQLIGYVTSAAISRPCEQGDAWFQNGTEALPIEGRITSLPWDIRFDSFTGALPRITGVRVQFVRMGWLIHIELSDCLYGTSEAKPSFAILELGATGQVEGLRWDETKFIPVFVTLRGFCEQIVLKKRGTYFVQRTTTKVIVRLVQ